MTPERFCGEEAVRQRPGFSHDHGQNRIVLECQPDEVVRDGGRKQPPGGFPERIDISRPVEAKQRPLDYGIDDWFALHNPALGPKCARSGVIAILFIRLQAARCLQGPGKVGD